MEKNEGKAHDWQGAIGAHPPTTAQGLELWHLRPKESGRQNVSGRSVTTGRVITLRAGTSLLPGEQDHSDARRGNTPRKRKKSRNAMTSNQAIIDGLKNADKVRALQSMAGGGWIRRWRL